MTCLHMKQTAERKGIILWYWLKLKHLQLLNSVDILIKTTLSGYYEIIAKAGFHAALKRANTKCNLGYK